MIVSGAAPPMLDPLRRVRRWMSRRVLCRFGHARSRVPIACGPFHYCASCERAAPDAPETIDDQRRGTRCRYRTIYGGPRGSASLPAPAREAGRRIGVSAYRRLRRGVFATCGKGRAPARPAAARPMIVSGAAPPRVDALRRVRRWMSRRVFCRFCHARSRVPMACGPFHYCAFCERAAPDAPETIDDQRRCTRCRDRTIYGGSRGSASLPRPRSGSVLSLLQCIPNRGCSFSLVGNFSRPISA